MKPLRSTLLIPSIVLLAGFINGCTPGTEIQKQPLLPEQIIRSKALYAAHCSSCHGTLAKGGISGPDLTATTFKYGKNQSAIVRSILEGRPGGMPAFGMHVSAIDAQNLAVYLLQL